MPRGTCVKQFFKDDQNTLDMINEVFLIGSCLYTMAIQKFVCWVVFQDPEMYSLLLPINILGAKTFKQGPSAKGMKRFLVEKIVSRIKGSTPCKYWANNVLAKLGASEDQPASTSRNIVATVSSDRE